MLSPLGAVLQVQLRIPGQQAEMAVWAGTQQLALLVQGGAETGIIKRVSEAALPRTDTSDVHRESPDKIQPLPVVYSV